MPFSQNTFDYYVGTVLDMLQPATALDIGPGEGKFARLMDEAGRRNNFSSAITAIEIDPAYVEQYQLRQKYETVVVGDCMDLLKTPRIRYDFCYIGDCIEHLRKSDGIDLVNFLYYRTGYTCIVTPEDYVQDDWEGHAAEAHISIWRPEDFAGFNVIHKSWHGMSLFLIRGLQPARARITG